MSGSHQLVWIDASMCVFFSISSEGGHKQAKIIFHKPIITFSDTHDALWLKIICSRIPFRSFFLKKKLVVFCAKLIPGHLCNNVIGCRIPLLFEILCRVVKDTISCLCYVEPPAVLSKHYAQSCLHCTQSSRLHCYTCFSYSTALTKDVVDFEQRVLSGAFLSLG